MCYTQEHTTVTLLSLKQAIIQIPILTFYQLIYCATYVHL